jgi:hypothetical protein
MSEGGKSAIGTKKSLAKESAAVVKVFPPLNSFTFETNALWGEMAQTAY